ncbi:prophage side tail fiber protein homolog StfR-like [Procambarus clarkii]|uniref:prophage side tail fiber protein homolog StfR-like n=1 Tax=Procambarus clarkii TaxID=6728 RepID=UPI00374434C1
MICPPLGVGGAKSGVAEAVIVPRDPSPSIVPSDLIDPTPAIQQFGLLGPLVSDAAASLPVFVITAEVHLDLTVTDVESGTPIAAAPSCVDGSGDPAGPQCGVAPSSGGRASDVVAAAPVVLRSSRGSRGPSPVAASDQPRRKREARTRSTDTGPPVKRGGSTPGAAVAYAPPPAPPSGGLLGSVAPEAPSGGSEAPMTVEDAQWVMSTGVEGIGRDALTMKFAKSTKSVVADVPVAPSAARLPDDAPTVPVAFSVEGSGAPSQGTEDTSCTIRSAGEAAVAAVLAAGEAAALAAGEAAALAAGETAALAAGEAAAAEAAAAAAALPAGEATVTLLVLNSY